MPYKNKDKQREYQRKWIAKRRADYFRDKVCARCGSEDDLQLDHIDPTTKVSHSIWSWSDKKRLAELAKCQVLCYICHKDKTNGTEGDLHNLNIRVSASNICTRGHDMNLVGYKKNRKPNGFVAKQCSYCSHINYCLRKNKKPLSQSDFVAKRAQRESVHGGCSVVV